MGSVQTPPEWVPRLIERACPVLAPVTLKRLGQGWDHDVYLADERYVFRFPRTEAARDALSMEAAVLPWIAAHLPLAIPKPVRHEVDGQTFASHEYLPGRTACDAQLTIEQRAALAPALGTTLRQLHALAPAEAPAPLPADQLRRFDPPHRIPETLRLLEQLRQESAIPAEVCRTLRAIIEAPPSQLPDQPTTVVHADPHLRNLIVDPQGLLAGLIDWVDLHAGHRALDLTVLYEVLPPKARAGFEDTYGTIDETSRRWARWRAVDHMMRASVGARLQCDELFARACGQALMEAAVE